ncbi:DUF3208 domain-containing protein [Deinococcus pimensis]|uniref:DUF3208 domain-containing protein n=1 Tax=Deinococcus pimensis TaxID=309888 RepID=UPI000488944D|nr:DUF3208 domain-containing protein [Deinococcus pimensis]
MTPQAPGAAVRLLQGYVWHPREATYDARAFIPEELADAHLLLDEVTPPFAFFENGQLTSTQTFYQFTALRLYDERPDDATLHAHAERLSEALAPRLDASPPDLGWQLWEDLRDL